MKEKEIIEINDINKDNIIDAVEEFTESVNLILEQENCSKLNNAKLVIEVDDRVIEFVMKKMKLEEENELE